MKNSKQLREERAAIVEQMRGLVNTAEAENRALNAEENEKWGRMESDAEELRSRYERLEQSERMAIELAGRQSESVERGAQAPDAETRNYDAFKKYLRHGVSGLNAEERSIIESRAQAIGTGAAGGFTVPTLMASTLEVALKTYGAVRSLARIVSTEGGGIMNWPTMNGTPQKGKILAENTAAAALDTTFGNVALGAYTYTSDIIAVSRQLLQDSAFDLEGYLGQELASRLGRITNEHYTTGNGTSQPQGVVAGATASGVSAGASAITVDNLIDLQHSVDIAYRVNGAFMFGDTTLQALRKLKDLDGRYIWQPGTVAGEPDTILGKPYAVNPDMANIGTGNRSVIFGDMSKYLIRDVLGVSLMRLDERYAENFQVAYVGFMRTDAKILDAGTNPIKALIHA
jgi:HK97 family phage major capsid protein